MPLRPEHRSFATSALPLLIAEFLIVAGAGVLYGWRADGSISQGIVPDMVSMLRDAGIALILAGLALAGVVLLLLDHRNRGRYVALAERNALLCAVSDNTPDAIFVKDRRGRMIFANPAMLRILGKDSAAVIGHSSADIYADATDARTVEESDRNIMASGQPEALEQTVTFSDGVRTFQSTKAPWTDDRGDVIGLVGISTDITDRKRTEDALRAHETQLERLVAARTAEVSELVGHLESTREEEKRAIAQELHDDLGSAFTALSMHLDILFLQMPAEPSLTERGLQVKALVKSVIDAARRIQIGLRPDNLDIFGIKVAISEQTAEFEKYTGINCVADLPDEDLAFSPQQDIALFRIVQEALNNVAKHAKATRVDVILDESEDMILLTVRDNGVGIAPGRSGTITTHGLRGMRERAGYLGGQVRIATAKDKGTTVTATLPKIRVVERVNGGSKERLFTLASRDTGSRPQLFQ